MSRCVGWREIVGKKWAATRRSPPAPLASTEPQNPRNLVHGIRVRNLRLPSRKVRRADETIVPHGHHFTTKTRCAETGCFPAANSPSSTQSKSCLKKLPVPPVRGKGSSESSLVFGSSHVGLGDGDDSPQEKLVKIPCDKPL